jgi:hypothetical protein
MRIDEPGEHEPAGQIMSLRPPRWTRRLSRADARNPTAFNDDPAVLDTLFSSGVNQSEGVIDVCVCYRRRRELSNRQVQKQKRATKRRLADHEVLPESAHCGLAISLRVAHPPYIFVAL